MRLIKQQWQRQRPFTWLLTLLLTAIVVACGPTAGGPGVEALPTDTPPAGEPAPDTDEPGTGTDERESIIDWAVVDLTGGPVWHLVQYGPANNPTLVLDETTVTLNFEEDGQLNGSAGCNQYSGSYELDGRAITIGPLVTTLMACLDDGVMEQESAFLQALEAAHNLSLIEDRLTIIYDEGELHFGPQEAPEALPLEGTEWRLETAVQIEGDAVSALLVPDDLEVTLLFENGDLSGFNGCNSYGGNYTLENGDLHIDEVFQTVMDCGDHIASEVEAQMRPALPNMESYDITGNRLTITYPGGELIFIGHR